MSRATTLEERLKINTLSEGGLTDQAIAEKMGRSLSVVRKWRRRHQKEGRPGLASKMGRPRQGALSSYPEKMRKQIAQMRQNHPGWGPKTIYTEISLSDAEKRIPAPASIGRYLKEQGLSRNYQRHTQLPNSEKPTVTKPHQLWKMDASGPKAVPELGLVALINISDCVSRLRAMSYPVISGKKRVTHNPDTADYQAALRLAFSAYGMPERIQVDRAAVFHDNHSKSPFPTRLHLWLIALGIDLCFSRPRMPTDQAIVERSHQLWDQQCLQGQTYATWQALFHRLRKRRKFINQYLPCASLDNKPSLIAFPDASFSGREYRPEYECELLDLSRLWSYLAKGQWFRRISKVGTFSIGGQQYYLDYSLARQQVELSFDPDLSAFTCLDEIGAFLAHIPIEGISVDTLMGDFPYHLPDFQLHLPFDWKSLQVVRLFETMVS